jgi:hypothetical protein
MATLPIVLLNPGAEDGAGYDGDIGVPNPVVIPHWNQTGHPSVLLWANTQGFPTNADPGPPPGERGNNYFYGGPANALSVLTQTLSFAGYEAQVDANEVQFSLSAYLGGCPGQEDNAVITLVWKDGGGATILPTPQIGPVTRADRGDVNALLLRSTAGFVPPLARSVVVTLTMTRLGGSDNDGYADDIVLSFFIDAVGDFEDASCACGMGAPISLPPGIPGPDVVGDFEGVPCGECLSVFAAYALDGQTVRVVFDKAPVFRSPAGIDDAMNPANYAFSIDAGDAANPVATTVSPVLVVGPTRYVGNRGQVNQRGVDVHVDRPFVEGVTYRVTVANVTVSTAISAPFGGLVLLLQRPRSQRGKPTTNVDVANDLSRGSWFGDDSGDVASQDAFSGYRKRVFRRLTTPKDAFSFLKGYGLGQQLKSLASSARVAALKTDAEQQILLEPETAKVQVNVSISPLNYLTFSVRAWTRVGAFTEFGVRVAPDGTAALVSSP